MKILFVLFIFTCYSLYSDIEIVEDKLYAEFSPNNNYLAYMYDDDLMVYDVRATEILMEYCNINKYTFLDSIHIIVQYADTVNVINLIENNISYQLILPFNSNDFDYNYKLKRAVFWSNDIVTSENNKSIKFLEYDFQKNIILYNENFNIITEKISENKKIFTIILKSLSLNKDGCYDIHLFSIDGQDKNHLFSYDNMISYNPHKNKIMHFEGKIIFHSSNYRINYRSIFNDDPLGFSIPLRPLLNTAFVFDHTDLDIFNNYWVELYNAFNNYYDKYWLNGDFKILFENMNDLENYNQGYGHMEISSDKKLIAIYDQFYLILLKYKYPEQY